MHATNRVLWTVLALLFVVTGAFGVAAGVGALPSIDRNTVVLTPQFLDRWRSIGNWAWGALTGAGLLVALLGLGLVRVELRRRRGPQMGDLTEADLPRPEATVEGGLPGFTRVRTAALAKGVEHDLTQHPTVRSATVGLTGRPRLAAVQAWLDVAAGTDLAQLRQYVVASLDRLTATSGLRLSAVRVVVRLRDEAGARVR